MMNNAGSCRYQGYPCDRCFYWSVICFQNSFGHPFTLVSSGMMDCGGSCRVKDTLATASFFPVIGFQDSCDLLPRPLGRAMTVVKNKRKAHTPTKSADSASEENEGRSAIDRATERSTVRSLERVIERPSDRPSDRAFDRLDEPTHTQIK